MHDWRLTRPDSADVPELLRIEAASFGRPWSENAFLAELTHPASSAFLARVEAKNDGDAIAGYIFLRGALDEAEILKLVTAREWRRRGVASEILARSLAAAADARTVFLETRPSNRAAVAFYGKNGFHAVGRRPGYYTDPREDALIFMKKL